MDRTEYLILLNNIVKLRMELFSLRKADGAVTEQDEQTFLEGIKGDFRELGILCAEASKASAVEEFPEFNWQKQLRSDEPD